MSPRRSRAGVIEKDEGRAIEHRRRAATPPHLPGSLCAPAQRDRIEFFAVQ